MRRTISRVLVLAGLFLFMGALSAQAQQKQKGDRDKITKDDRADAPGIVVSAMDAVRVLRPNWLNASRMHSSVLSGGSTGAVATDLVVYIDGIRQTSKDELAQLKASLVFEMKFLDQNRAVQDHGPGHELGVIEVTTISKKR